MDVYSVAFHSGAVGGGLVDHTTGYRPEEPHYAVTVAGGAAEITIVEVQ